MDNAASWMPISNQKHYDCLVNGCDCFVTKPQIRMGCQVHWDYAMLCIGTTPCYALMDCLLDAAKTL